MNKDDNKGQDLHQDIFGGDAKLTAFDENSEKPISELVKDAQDMIAGGHTYTVLIPDKGILYLQGVPFIPVKIKSGELRLKPIAGYNLAIDNKANRKRLGYVELEEEEKGGEK